MSTMSAFRVDVFEILRVDAQPLPQFTEDANAALQADLLSVGVSDDGGHWQTLEGWLKPDADGLDATVLCRKAGLTITFRAKGDGASSPLPFGADSPVASLLYSVGAGAERTEHEQPMECVVDVSSRTMQLVLDFTTLDEYAAMVDVLSDSNSGVQVKVTASHQYAVTGPPQQGAAGGFVGAPSTVARNPGACNVYVRGSDNALWQNGWWGGEWHGWGRHEDGGVITSVPAPGTLGPDHEHVFARGTDDQVWQKWWTGDGGWSGWVALGAPPVGFIGSPSTVARNPGACNIYVRGGDNALWQRGWWDNEWHDWGRHDDGGTLMSEPAVGTLGPDHEHIFVRGTDDQVWQKWWTGDGGWSGWVALGAPPVGFVGAPSTVARNPGACNVYVRGGDNALWQNGWWGGEWHGWGRHDDGGVITSEPAPGTLGPDHEHVFARGTDDQVWQKWWTGDAGWSGWIPLGAPPTWNVLRPELILVLPEITATTVVEPDRILVPGIRDRPISVLRQRARRLRVDADVATPAVARDLSRAVVTGLTINEPLLVANEMLAPAVARATLRRNPAMLDVLRTSSDLGRLWTAPTLAADEPQNVSNATVESVIVRSMHRPDSDSAVYPDTPRAAQNGWGQVPDRDDAPALHFKDSPRPDVYFFLPTEFRLGFFRGTEPSGEGDLAPIRVTQYLGSDGGYRVKVTLVALPYISDADRNALGQYIREGVLRGTARFVELQPRAGLRADFVSGFTAGGTGDQVVLPETITFTAEEVSADQRLQLLFDMEAVHYGIFCELLKKGIRGRITLKDDGLQATIDVSLRLDRLTTNRLPVTAAGFGVPPTDTAASEPAAPPEADETAVDDAAKPEHTLTMNNVLSHPVRVKSLTVFCLDRGPRPEWIWNAERLDLLAEELTLDPRDGVNASAMVDVTPEQIGVWDDMVVQLGEINVDGGAPQEWLDRVNRDPSLQPQRQKITVSTVVPASPGRPVQVVRVKVFGPNDTAPRTDIDAPPGGSVELVIEQSLAELAAAGAEPLAYLLEFAALYDDGELSLPQRIEISPSARELTLPVLIELPGSTFAVEHHAGGAAPETSPGLDRAAAQTLTEQLRSAGELWRITARRSTTSTDTETPTTPATPESETTDPQGGNSGEPRPTPTGPAIAIVNDLIAPRLGDGTLKKVLLQVQPDRDGAPTTSFQFDATHSASAEWLPPAGVPPFRYRVTYILADETTRQASGTENGMILLLDPPA